MKDDISNPHFLLADDDIHLSALLKRSLRTRYPNATFAEVHDGPSVLEQLLAQTPTLILLDINMPGWSGIETCRRIREDARYDSVKVLIITADPTPERRDQAISAGADAFLAKPFLLDPLIGVISKLLGEKEK